MDKFDNSSTANWNTARLHRITKQLELIHIESVYDFPEPKAESRAYVLDRLPSADVLSCLTEEYDGGESELGILAIAGYIFLTTPMADNPLSIVTPDFLNPFLRQGLFALDLHSHPIGIMRKSLESLNAIEYRRWPDLISWEDLSFISNTWNGKIHVAERKGLIVAEQPQQLLPGGLDFRNLAIGKDASQLAQELDISFYQYLVDENLLDVVDIFQQRVHKQGYLKHYFEYRQIPWQREDLINAELEAQLSQV